MTAVPTFATVSMDEVVANIKMALKIDGVNTEDFYLKRWAREASVAISADNNYVEKFDTVLDINDNHCACLPPDYAFLGVEAPCKPALVYQNECECEDICCCVWIPCEPVIQNGYIRFSNQVTARTCKINYTAINVDEQGELILPASHLRAMVAYACYQWRKSEGYPLNVWVDDKNTWINCKMSQKGESKRLNPFRKDLLRRIMNYSPEQYINYYYYL